MEKEYSLMNFLDRIIILEEKFCSFVLETKKETDYDEDKIRKLKEIVIENIIIELIPITDSMEMFAKNFDSNQTKESEIIFLIFKLIKKFYKKFNIKQISETGVLFNPDIHEAIGIYPTFGKKKGTVKTILQPGYTRNSKLIRPALVIVYN
ncbi:nucleotide exchange factor GrpE [Candidatus Carsonella ruddii]|uniref:Protein GrpE n=1 Tax=Carsonella ruddii TaxID=114186 RepID=A0AAE7G449_CARRU|nr:nucleotide exchange factor GrpE [Candidatus Carsonella ruddii]AGS06567.1 molecular chaperone GrpE [Candidatus Carsonella ruddii DC]ALA96821.1 hypothetical protein AMC76_00430 [Candidatus Carsonella ruddii]QLK14047.1 nucleotide exchange factor GrpE [Candidatus Carsonella ruddii]